jgi:hypothetical protein
LTHIKSLPVRNAAYGILSTRLTEESMIEQYSSNQYFEGGEGGTPAMKNKRTPSG